MPNIRDLLFDQGVQEAFIRTFCARLRQVASGPQATHAEHAEDVSVEILERPYSTPLHHTYLVSAAAAVVRAGLAADRRIARKVLFVMSICEDELIPQLTDPPSVVRAYFGRSGLRRRMECMLCGTPATADRPARPSLTPVQIVSEEWMRCAPACPRRGAADVARD